MAPIRQESTVIVFTFGWIGWNRNEINGRLTYFVTIRDEQLFYDEYSEFKKKKKGKENIYIYIDVRKFSWIIKYFFISAEMKYFFE